MNDTLVVILEDAVAGALTRLRGGRVDLVADRSARCRGLLSR